MRGTRRVNNDIVATLVLLGATSDVVVRWLGHGKEIQDKVKPCSSRERMAGLLGNENASPAAVLECNCSFAGDVIVVVVNRISMSHRSRDSV